MWRTRTKKEKKMAVQTFGVIGCGKSTGVTHLVIRMASFLSGACGKQVAVLEWNRHKDFEQMEVVCTGKISDKKPFRILAVDYYKHAGREELSVCREAGYHYILIDFGRADAEQTCDCLGCDRKLVLGSTNEWQLGGFLEFVQQRGNRKEGWEFAVIFGNEETRRTIEKRWKLSVVRVPVSVDPFTVTGDELQFLEEFMKQ